MNDEEVSSAVIGAAISVHKALGPGLLESAYQACLLYELRLNGLYVEREKKLPVVYRGLQLDCAYRIDLVVERLVIVEVKSVEQFTPIDYAQILTYLRLLRLRLGLLLNFKVPVLKKGIRRLISSESL